MKKLISLLMLCALPAFGITPFTFSANNSDGSPQTNPVLMRAFPPNINGVTVYGTNIIFGANYLTNTPNASGFWSNSVLPNLYQFYVPNLGQYFYANILDTTNCYSLATYLTNAAYVSATFPGYIPATYAGVSNAVGFVLATNGGALAYSQLPFTPPTNSFGSQANAKFFTNGTALWIYYQTNALPGGAFTNQPWGSIMTTTNGGRFTLSNAVWVVF